MILFVLRRYCTTGGFLARQVGLGRLRNASMTMPNGDLTGRDLDVMTPISQFAAPWDAIPTSNMGTFSRRMQTVTMVIVIISIKIILAIIIESYHMLLLSPVFFPSYHQGLVWDGLGTLLSLSLLAKVLGVLWCSSHNRFRILGSLLNINFSFDFHLQRWRSFWGLHLARCNSCATSRLADGQSDACLQRCRKEGEKQVTWNHFWKLFFFKISPWIWVKICESFNDDLMEWRVLWFERSFPLRWCKFLNLQEGSCKDGKLGESP